MSDSHRPDNASSAPWWISNPSREWMRKLQHQPQQRLLLQQLQLQNHNEQLQPQDAEQHLVARQRRRSSAFCQNLGELLRNIALHGYGKLLDPALNLWERLIWFIVHLTTFFILVTMLSFAWEAFVAQYVVIHLHDPLYPVENVPFPAVSICSNNRISMQEATLYAQELHDKDPMNQSVAYFLERIGFFASMYEKLEEMYDYNRMQAFQSFLDTYDTWDNETFFNVHRIMRRLAPKCVDLLMKCMLGGKEIDCLGSNGFQESVTVYGPCCTFNGADTQRDSSNRLFNAELGLTVMLNTSSYDDFEPILNSDGYIVIIHSPSIYPDVTSGSSRGIFPTRGEESFIALRARIIDTESALRSLGPISRRCYFTDEALQQDNLISGHYNFANCITQCRIRSMSALCGCVPFYMPLPPTGRPPQGVVICTLQHMQCLKRYRYKWLNVLTQRVAIPGLERSMEDALFCPQCLPSCVDVQYDLSQMSLPTDRVIVSLNLQAEASNSNDTLNLVDMSVLRVYFGELHAQYYRRTVGNTWFEAFSTVGNICSIFVGFSMVAVGELLYFLIKQLTAAVRAFIHQQRQQQLQQKRKHQKQQRKRSANANAVQLYILP